MPAILLIAALATVFFFPGYDRGQFYRATEHDAISAFVLTVATNLSPEHGFLQFTRRHLGADGEPTYEPYHRFPLLGYALIKLAGLPFGDDLPGRLRAARMLMLAFFCGAALLAYCSLRRLTGRRVAALAATLIAFSSHPLLYYGDMVATDGVVDLFAVMLAFHGVAVYSQRRAGRRGDVGDGDGRPDGAGGGGAGLLQLHAKTCAALLLGWHVYGLLLPLLLAALPHAAWARDWREFRRYLLLGAAAAFVGVATLAFNLAREHVGLGGSTPFLELPSVESVLRRTSVAPVNEFIGWGALIEDQFRRLGEAALPWALAEPLQGRLHGRWHWVGGACMALAAAAIAWPGTRHRVAWSGLALCGLGWALPVRDSAQQHEFEALFHVGGPLVAGALVLIRLQALATLPAWRTWRVDRLVKATLVASALALFVASSWSMRRIGDDADTRQWERMILADVREIRRHTQGKVVYAPKAVLATNPCCWPVHLTGSIMEVKPPPVADFVVATDIPRSDPARPPPANSPASRSLTPRNRVVFLYQWDAYRKALIAARGVYERHARTGDPPAIASLLDVHQVGDALLYVGEGDRCPKERYYEPRFFLRVYPVDLNDLPPRWRREGFVNVHVRRDRHWTSDGRCFALGFLPTFPIGAIHTGQAVTRGGFQPVWEGRFAPRDLASNAVEEAAAARRREYQRIAAGDPAARAAWDIHFARGGGGGREVVFLKARCANGDSTGRFFLHVVPVDADVLPASRFRLGFDNWDFLFQERGGARFDGKCMVRALLPDYDIATVRTGQFDPAAGVLWRVEFPGHLLPGAVAQGS